jgi:hypothetical protein
VKRTVYALAVALLAQRAWAAEPVLDDAQRACFSAVEEGQRLRIEHKLVEARDRLLQCSRPACPALFRNDCAQWLAEVQAALPSVVFGAKDARGQDLFDVAVYVDDRRVVARLAGTSMDIDPGPHVFRFEWEGHPAVEQKALIREGEKERQVVVSIGDAEPAKEPGGASPGIPAGVWVFGGVGLAGLAGFAGLIASTDADVNHLRATCAPGCAPGPVSGEEAKLGVAYASLAVGVASLGAAATWLLLTRGPRREAATARLSVEPVRGGGRALLTVSF